MDNTAPLTLALLHSAKKNNITTYYLQHGVYVIYKDYRILEKRLTINKSNFSDVKQVKSKVNFSTFQFIKNSLGFRLLRPFTLLYLFFSKLWGNRKAAYIFKDSLRIPDKYLCYSLQNATLHKEIDGISDDKIKLIGNPELQQIISNYRNATCSNSEQYWLFVDQALSGSDIGESFITKARHHKIYTLLAEKALANNCTLMVKLHPGSYNDTNLPYHKNITWVKDITDMTGLIKGAEYCVGFCSSLLLPCIIYKPTLLIKIAELSFYQKMSKFSNVEVCTESSLSQWVPNYSTVDKKQSEEIMNYLGVSSKLNYVQQLKELVTIEC